MDRLKQLEIKKILNEYSLIKVNEEYVKEMISENSLEFLKQINECIDEETKAQNEASAPKEEGKEEAPNPKKETIYNIDAFPDSTKSKMKKIYREIVKLTHPDKITSEKLNKLYIVAKEAYHCNDLMELFCISTELDIPIEIESEEIAIFNSIIDDKRKKSKALESSYVWLWIHADTEEKKKSVVDFFIERNYGKKKS